jgi:hypothetical protein
MMRSNIRLVTILVAVLWILGVALLIFSGGNTTLIGLGIIFLPALLILQAWVILREPPDGKEFPDDQWYEK